MSSIAILGFLIGAVFGTRFNVLVLLPLSVFGGLNTFFVALILGEPLSIASLTSVVLVLALQGGYMFGSLTRMTIAATRISQVDKARSPVRES